MSHESAIQALEGTLYSVKEEIEDIQGTVRAEQSSVNRAKVALEKAQNQFNVVSGQLSELVKKRDNIKLSINALKRAEAETKPTILTTEEFNRDL